MTQVQKENCPICWRDFTSQTEPLLISCGHSFCSDCVASITNRCPVCRCRVQVSFKAVKNFSLLSQLDKIDQYFAKDGQPETQEQPEPDQSPQLELEQEQPALILAQPKPRRRSNIIKTQSKSTTIRLMQGEEGRCNGITLRFK